MIPDAALAAWLPTNAAESRALIQALRARAAELGISLPDPPTEPTNCCDSGCIGCVWEGYGQEVAWWRDDAMQAWAR
ncbi:oxidoreductase-like domain-containing protein [Ideonella sp.]|uniref:oxidoreductase-like domain-containing protein n=1 Tax=Ideonella sp. TaxID=1929293 RepID=UPI003BB5C936